MRKILGTVIVLGAIALFVWAWGWMWSALMILAVMFDNSRKPIRTS